MSILSQDQLGLAVHKSVDALLVQQRASGAMNGYCCSRVLESTLTLHLLRNQAYSPDKQKRIEGYLLSTMAPTGLNNLMAYDRIVALIAQCVVNQGSLSQSSSQEILSLLSEREQGRKLLYFGCFMAEMGVVSFSSLPFTENTFQAPRKAVQTWAQVMLCSLKVLYYCGISAENLITSEERNLLKCQLLETDIYENNILTQIVGLLALSKLLPQIQLEPSLAALMSWQQADGGIPLMTGLDHFVTPLAGLAILDTLPMLVAQQQQTARAATIQMAKFLASVQEKNGGWSYMTGTLQTDMDDSGLCAALLARVDSQHFRNNLQRFHRYLVQMQNDDGGFPTYIEGNPSTPSMTAAALHAMVEIVRKTPEWPLWQVPIQKALHYLLASQQTNGTFERRWSNAETHAMFRVAISLRLLRQVCDLPAVKNPIDIMLKRMALYLSTTQNPNGGWGQIQNDSSDVNSTAFAVLCAAKSERKLATAGVNFLLAQQGYDGTFRSRPDLMGPRPLPYDIPILSTISATHALGYFFEKLT